MKVHVNTSWLAISALLFVMGSAYAAEPAAGAPAPSKQDREQMAQLHEKMATCLRSDKSMEECHKEMAAQCRESMGADKCKGMAEHAMKHEHSHMDSSKDTSTTSKP